MTYLRNCCCAALSSFGIYALEWAVTIENITAKSYPMCTRVKFYEYARNLALFAFMLRVALEITFTPQMLAFEVAASSNSWAIICTTQGMKHIAIGDVNSSDNEQEGDDTVVAHFCPLCVSGPSSPFILADSPLILSPVKPVAKQSHIVRSFSISAAHLRHLSARAPPAIG